MEGRSTEPSPDPPLKIGDHPNALARRALARPLHGLGVEFGPGCHPLPLGPFVTQIRYCDKFDRARFAELFPEANDTIDQFPDPIEIQLNFEAEDFAQVIGPASVDFVVASHVLEHLVNPLIFLERSHRLLRPGGLLYLALPDLRSNFDRDRQRTTLADAVDRYRRGATQLTDEQIVDFVNKADQPKPAFGPETPDYSERIERIRERSIHVNVWLVEDVIELLEYAGRSLKCAWEIVDGLVTPLEFIFILRKQSESSALDRYGIVLDRIWYDSHRWSLQSEWQPRLEELERLILACHDRILVLDERARETQSFVRQFKSALEKFPGAKRWARWFVRKREEGQDFRG